jgi:ABC-type transporter lipoprotein component MlaA/pimeloyl-ACP methyl ester carboxylesterase
MRKERPCKGHERLALGDRGLTRSHSPGPGKPHRNLCHLLRRNAHVFDKVRDAVWKTLLLRQALVAIVLGLSQATGAPAQGISPPSPPPDTIVLPEAVPDPIEPVNRVFWGLNKGIMTGAIKPTAKVYRFIVRKPIRTGIANFGRNITYPGRLINNLLQAKWEGARDESYRFGCNTVLGAAGFFDVATKLKIPKSDADFGQTFGQWGWKPNFFLMLPIYGPSNDRDTVGLAADTAANPLTYLSPYPFDTSQPLTFLSPYTYYSYVVTYNNLSGTVEGYVRFAQTQQDAYWELEYAWGFVRENKVVNFQVQGTPDEASLETLQSVFFTFQNLDFPNRGRTRSVFIPATGKRLDFTCWLQPTPAPVVYVIPGLGSHRLAETALALAELVYQNGFSAVTVSNPFNYEFMKQASTADVPGYPPVDAYDLHSALTEIDHYLEKLYPGRLRGRALMGYSMGGFYSMLMAGAPGHGAPLLQFDRYLAINTPVRLLYGISRLDEFYQAPLAWPAAERTQDIENTFLKVAALTHNSFTPQTSLPFSGIESRFLIGLTFRLILRDAIYTSQERHNMGVLQHPIRTLRREPLYREIQQYSYNDYFQRFVLPDYRAHGLEPDHLLETFDKAGDLRTYAAGLQAHPTLRLIANENDFLLADSDLVWLRATFPPSQLTVFKHGGHLGNLSDPDVQKAILGALRDGPRQSQ